jgi:hypothetical protein
MGQVWWYIAVLPATREVEFGGLRCENSKGKDLARPHVNISRNKPGMVACTYDPRYWEEKLEDHGLRPVLRKNIRSKTTQLK